MKHISILIIIFLINSISFGSESIKPDKRAASWQRPIVDKSPNEVYLINIVSPTSRGVSYNKFEDYNVPIEGVILNNSVRAGRSVLGGMLYGNPNFQLNEQEADIV